MHVRVWRVFGVSMVTMRGAPRADMPALINRF